jgi:hypothetical protein
MTNDEAGNRVMTFMASTLTAFLKVARSNSTFHEDAGPKEQMMAISALVNNAVKELTTGELGQAMEILIDAQKPVPEGTQRGTIPQWIDSVLYGTGGLRAWHKYELGGSKPSWQEVGAWIIRCLANPACANSGSINMAIMNERARKLGLPEDGDLERMLAGGVLDDNMASKGGISIGTAEPKKS